MEFDIFFYVIVFGFGAIIGSFPNVVILRYKTGMNLQGRSKCFSCGRTLRWLDLIPIFSFLGLKGKCKGCHSRISWQYPLVEFITATLFLLIYAVYFDPANSISTAFVAMYWIAAALLVVMAVYDIKHKIIPDPMVFSFIGLSAIAAGLSLAYTDAGMWDVLAGPVLWAFPFAIIWKLSNGRAMGFGDAKLAWGIGWFLGMAGGISAICLAFWIGAVAGVAGILYGKIKNRIVHGKGLNSKEKHLTMKSEIPFAPYLIIGFFLVLLAHADVLKIVSAFVNILV